MRVRLKPEQKFPPVKPHLCACICKQPGRRCSRCRRNLVVRTMKLGCILVMRVDPSPTTLWNDVITLHPRMSIHDCCRWASDNPKWGRKRFWWIWRLFLLSYFPVHAHLKVWNSKMEIRLEGETHWPGAAQTRWSEGSPRYCFGLLKASQGTTGGWNWRRCKQFGQEHGMVPNVFFSCSDDFTSMCNENQTFINVINSKKLYIYPMSVLRSANGAKFFP